MTTRDKILKEVSDFYFIHCKPKVRPEFKTLDQASNWHRKNIYIIERLVGKTTDRIMNVIEEYITK